jgi:outer membrane protein assembly factor BamA
LDYLLRDGTSPLGPVRQLSPVLGAGFFRDERDLRVDPSRGTVASAFGELVSGWLTDDTRYFRSTLDGRGFLSLGRGFVVASRVSTVFTTGDVPEYRRVGVGGRQSIRGQPESVELGNSLALASMELRFPLLSRKRFNLPVPLVPKRISNVDLRVDGELFMDGGTAWDDNVGFRNARIRKGAGVGLRIFLPVFEIARFEFAFDESGNPTLSLTEGNLI